MMDATGGDCFGRGLRWCCCCGCSAGTAGGVVVLWLMAHDRRSEVLEQGALGVLQLVESLHKVIVGSLELLHAFGELSVLF